MNKRANAKIAMSSFLALEDELETTTVRLVDIDDAEYHSNDAVSKTKLNEFLDSSLVFFYRYIEGTMPLKKQTKEMAVGSVVHAVLLEGKSLDDLIAVYPDSVLNSAGAINSRGAEYKAWAAENEGKYWFKQADVSSVTDCVKAVMDSELANLVKSATHRERSIFWTDAETGLECRCKPDFFCELPDRVIGYDLKISPMVSPEAFLRQVKRFRYWLQDAHYSTGLSELYQKPVQFRFWVVEPVKPHRIKCYWLEEINTRTTAFERWSSAMKSMAECFRSGDWSDKWDGKLVLNQWDFGGEVDEELNWEE